MSLRLAAVALVVLSCAACTSTSSHVETVPTDHKRLLVGEPLGYPRQLLAVVRRRAEATEIHVASVLRCTAVESRIVQRVGVHEKEVSGFATVAAVLLAGIGFVVYALPSDDVAESATVGSTLIVIGGLWYAIPALGASTERSASRREQRQVVPPVPCHPRPPGARVLLVRDTGSVHEVTTDENGYASLDSVLHPPIGISVDGEPILVVEQAR